MATRTKVLLRSESVKNMIAETELFNAVHSPVKCFIIDKKHKQKEPTPLLVEFFLELIVEAILQNVNDLHAYTHV